MQLLALSIALAPYLAFVVIDAWMHERARQVPTLEQWLHGGIALLVGSFILAAFIGAKILAWVLLLMSLPLMAADELGFHRHLSRRERRVHLAEGLSFVIFIFVWLWTNYRL